MKNSDDYSSLKLKNKYQIELSQDKEILTTENIEGQIETDFIQFEELKRTIDDNNIESDHAINEETD